MNNFSSKVILCLGFIALLPLSNFFAQSHYIDSIQNERLKFNQELLHTDSVLNIEERSKIESLQYFPIDSTWVLTAKFKKRLGKEFEMPTTTSRKPKYQRIGFLIFKRGDEKFKLTVYKNIGLTAPEYKNYAFIPFKDANAPEITYGGGRYLDAEISLDMKTVVIDFNTAYNPYCVYSYRYSCPITPKENHIKVKVNAGIKNPVMLED
ncbi:MAG TPA: DUF1684 domain-containing protein [Brumimicrobium sp.]|nr:DUF1684 domain-containing protein [Brumimicrobium sp.]